MKATGDLDRVDSRHASIRMDNNKQITLSEEEKIDELVTPSISEEEDNDTIIEKKDLKTHHDNNFSVDDVNEFENNFDTTNK